MADEQTGVENQVPAAGEQSGVTPPAAGVEDQSQTSVTDGPEGQQASAEQEPQNIPYERFAKKVAETNEANARVAELEQEKAVADAIQQAGRQQTSQAPVDLMAQIIGGIGEFPTGDEVKEALGKVMGHVATVAATAEFARQCPDYDTLVGEPNAAGQYQPVFQKVIEKNPKILGLILNAPLQMQKQMAYHFAKGIDSPPTPEQQAAAQGIHPAAQAVINAAAKPLSPAAIGAGGSGLGKLNQIVDMTDEQFVAFVDKHRQEQG